MTGELFFFILFFLKKEEKFMPHPASGPAKWIML